MDVSRLSPATIRRIRQEVVSIILSNVMLGAGID